MSASKELFKKIRDAASDLQSADYQTYQRPLKTLARLLQDSTLQDVNLEITQNLDLTEFLRESTATQGSMAGSGQLLWPDDSIKTMGLMYLLICKFAHEPDYIIEFAMTYCYTGSQIKELLQNVCRQIIFPFVRDYQDYVMTSKVSVKRLDIPMANKVFVVHGHDEGAREAVARFLEKIGLDAIILHEQANQGRTVIEKVEAYGDVGFAVVILTPDDQGRKKDDKDLEPRARQNVLLELGYFIGRLGRNRVCTLKRGEVGIPSDFAGALWVEMSDGNAWKLALAKELSAAGCKVDSEAVLNA